MISFSPFLLLCDEQMDCSVSGLVELLEPTPRNSGQEMRKKKKRGGGERMNVTPILMPALSEIQFENDMS